MSRTPPPPSPVFESVPPIGAPPLGWPAGAPPNPPSSPPQQRPSDIPPELDRWNWGAFLLHWVWGLGNGTYIALLAWVPVLGILMMPFVLGARGSAWAWKNGRWDSVEHFRRVQRMWAIWGAIVWAVVLTFAAALVGGVLYALTSSDAYRLSVERLNASPQARSVLGTPISTGWPTGSINVGPGTGSAELFFSATGPKASGQVVMRARKDQTGWRLIVLRLTPAGENRTIDLLDEQQAALDPRRSS